MNNKFRWDEYSIVFNVMLRMEDFQRVLEKDCSSEVGDMLYFKLLEHSNIHANTYDPHFGPFIRVELLSPLDLEKVKSEIEQIIKDYIK
jgi:hypothetical protein